MLKAQCKLVTLLDQLTELYTTPQTALWLGGKRQKCQTTAQTRYFKTRSQPLQNETVHHAMEEHISMNITNTETVLNLDNEHIGRVYKVLPSRLKLILAIVPPQHDFRAKKPSSHSLLEARIPICINNKGNLSFQYTAA